MGWSGTTDGHEKTLWRVVALLLALADLAERASDRSLAVRCLVLWLLRPGEIMAHDYVARLTGGVGEPEAVAYGYEDDGASAAICLAFRFRTLAAVLIAFADEVFLSWGFVIMQAVRVGPSAAATPAAPRHPLTAVERRDSS